MVVEINNNKFVVKPAISSKQKEKGMMNQEFDSTFEGMLFFMNSSERHCFWMKNCITKLDIIFINNKKISKIHKQCEPCYSKDCSHYCGVGDFVLELNGGSCDKKGIKEGDSVKFLF